MNLSHVCLAVQSHSYIIYCLWYTPSRTKSLKKPGTGIVSRTVKNIIIKRAFQYTGTSLLDSADIQYTRTTQARIHKNTHILHISREIITIFNRGEIIVRAYVIYATVMLFTESNNTAAINDELPVLVTSSHWWKLAIPIACCKCLAIGGRALTSKIMYLK